MIPGTVGYVYLGAAAGNAAAGGGNDNLLKIVLSVVGAIVAVVAVGVVAKAARKELDVILAEADEGTRAPTLGQTLETADVPSTILVGN